MADEDTTTTETVAPAPAATPAKDAHLEQAIRERNAAKAKVRETENAMAELRARLDARDQEELQREHAIALKAGEFGKVEESYKQEIAKRDKALAEANAREAARERSSREQAMVETLAAKTGIGTGIVRGLLKVAAENGFDSAPAERPDSVVAEAIELMKGLAPELFKSRSTGAGTPGTHRAGDDVPAEIAASASKTAAFETARAMTTRRR